MKAYIGVDGKLYRQLIQPKLITIIRGEGPAKLCRKKQECRSFSQAFAVLLENSMTAPATGGYDKHDFIVEYEDGYTYHGRYDLKHYSCEPPDLAAHMRSFLSFLANDPNAIDAFDKVFIEDAREFLQKYCVDQPPIPVLPGEEFEIIHDYRKQPPPMNKF